MNANDWINAVRSLGRKKEAAAKAAALTHTLAGGPATTPDDDAPDEWTDEDQKRLQDPRVFTAFDRPSRLLHEIGRLAARRDDLRRHDEAEGSAAERKQVREAMLAEFDMLVRSPDDDDFARDLINRILPLERERFAATQGRDGERAAVLRFLEGMAEAIRVDRSEDYVIRQNETELLATVIHEIRKGNHVTKGGG